ncbi:PhzF family phenazine biosynthesis protein [Shimazuella kribbensis]|uniref:PhzF family phenazine biosynthesis protein n=1 Tax=Shimazuella kribbensis TaxID=139808 RepID=UPI0003F77E08|nr:PhzF family phenazine biosynthesis protein [Shimazuella kribbensis]
MGHPFMVVNSFTGREGVGNPAAIFYDAHLIDEAYLQPIAKQLNLVETVFVYPSKVADFHFRYFSPTEEIPVAGHPTVAAFLALDELQRIDGKKKENYRIETRAGIRQVRMVEKDEETKVYMKQAEPVYSSVIQEREKIAQTLGITEGDLLPDYPILSVDLGLQHLIVPVQSLAALLSIKRDIASLGNLCEHLGAKEVQAFTFETIHPHADVHTRNICPREGIEDPACGMGNAALGAYFQQIDRFVGRFPIIAEQGEVVDMPCEMEIDGKENALWIGGMGKVVIQGEYFV